jgi:hypothetical protein
MPRLFRDKLNALKRAFIEDCIMQTEQVGVYSVWLR